MKKLIGRPTVAPKDGITTTCSFRVTADLKRRLIASADAAGHSMSREAETRLEQSYLINDLKQAIDDIPKQIHLAVDHAIKRAGVGKETAAKRPFNKPLRPEAILRLLRKEGPCNVSDIAGKLKRNVGEITVACGSLVKSGAVVSQSEAGRMVLSLPRPSAVS